jgi:hypothetical protein
MGGKRVRRPSQPLGVVAQPRSDDGTRATNLQPNIHHDPDVPRNRQLARSRPEEETCVEPTYDLSSKLTNEELLSVLGWQGFVEAKRAPCDFNPNLLSLPHPAVSLLESFRQVGVPVKLTREVEAVEVEEALKRGPHRSTFDHLDFLHQEFATMQSKGHWVVLPYTAVRQLPGLRISPMGVVPQKERRPRTIVDYSFSGVNQHTEKLAPAESMQFGRTLHRLLWAIVHADPAHGPVYMFKLDIADGFYRLWVRPDDVPKLGVAYPTREGEPLEVAFPLALPMGWVESPPNFCAVTETVTDLANGRLRQEFAGIDMQQSPLGERTPGNNQHRLDIEAGIDMQQSPLGERTPGNNQHRLDIEADSWPADQPAPVWWVEKAVTAQRPPLALIDIYVDDFIGLAQGSQARLRAVRRVLFDAVDQVLRPLDDTDTGTNREEPISIKKLRKGDGAWHTRKVLLGWMVDSTALTIELTPSKAQRLDELLELPSDKRYISLKTWQQIIGQLRHFSYVIPGGKYLFSPLQEAMRKLDTRGRVSLNRAVHDALADFRWMVKDLSLRPTHLHEWFPDEHYQLGACDASGAGMGGVWYLQEREPIVWRATFPEEVKTRRITMENPAGTITNSDLELAASIVHLDIAVQAFPSQLQTLAVLSDNAATVHWQKKGSVSTTKATAYLLRLQGLHQRFFCYHSVFNHIAGQANSMADTASRSSAMSDAQFLHVFTCTFPQTRSWHLSNPRKEILLAVNSALLCARPKPESFLPPPDDNDCSGKSGPISFTAWDQSTRREPSAILTYATHPHTTKGSKLSCSSRPVYAPENSHPAKNRQELARWMRPFERFQRASKWTDAMTRANAQGTSNLTS